MSDRMERACAGWAIDELQPAERLFVSQAESQSVVDLAGEAIRGQLVRSVLCSGESELGASRFELKIANGVILGGLDFDGALVSRPVVFENSRVVGDDDAVGLRFRDASINRLDFVGCVIEGAILAARVRVENGMQFRGSEIRGAVDVSGGEFRDGLSLEGSQFGDGGRGLIAEGAQINGALDLLRAKISGTVQLARARLSSGFLAEGVEIAAHGSAWGIDARGVRIQGDFSIEGANIDAALSIPHVAIDGRLVADGARISSGREVCVSASGINVGHGASLRFAVLKGTVDLKSANIEKGIDATGLEVTGEEAAIVADGIVIGGNWDLSGAKLVGDLVMPGARIAGQLKFSGARLYGSDVAVRGDGGRIDGGCFLSRAVVIGCLRFPAAQFGSQFRLRGASLKVERGPALIASGSFFSRDVEACDGFLSVGALVFDQSQIRGTLDLSGSQISSCSLGRREVSAPAAGPLESHNDNVEGAFDETALSLVDSSINRIVMPSETEHRPRGLVDLARAHVQSYEDYAAAWPLDVDTRERDLEGRDIDHMNLDGFTYDHLSNPSGMTSGHVMHSRTDDQVARRRLSWLEGQEDCDIRDHFKPQPWVQLSARLSAQGYHDDARTISILRQRLSLSSHSTSAAQRWQGRFLDVFALFGHNPWRTLAWMAFFIVAFSGVWAWASASCAKQGCLDEQVFVVTNKDAYSSASFESTYPAFNPIGYSLDVFVPFVSFGYADHWRANVNWGPIARIPIPVSVRQNIGSLDGLSSEEAPDHARSIQVTLGGMLYILSVLETLIGITLISLAITGFTGLLRQD